MLVIPERSGCPSNSLNPHRIPDIGLISIPFIILVMVAEAIINQVDHLNLHEKKDSAINIFSGLVLTLVGLVFKLVALGVYEWVYQYRLFSLVYTPAVLIAAMLLCDFVFYIFHRLGHTCRLFWANHVVHHSSLHYNYTVGMRNHFIHLAYRFLFWVPLCWIGFDPLLIVFINNCTSLYQFFLHTQLIGKLGPLEWILNTPSHHRVHHGSNKNYIDKNFGTP